ncbi:MAG: hypothetical protein CEE42_08845 [Promethearchaeota archaeon Loki_b31]|nr:MAG: hypothetical protein CEE42_08845 [Candidatus Lokiarchaeota archaeon Loki_b31]
MTEEYADLKGVKICYEIRGDGDPLILIHGFGTTKNDWKLAQVDTLSEKFKIIIFDNRGAGKSDHPNEPYLMEIFADDTNALMEYLKIEKAHILGSSLGGMIAQTFAINYPNRINKLILINTTPSFPSNPSGIEMYKRNKITKYNAILKDPEKAFWEYGISGFSRNFKKMLQENPKKKFHGLFSAEDMMKEMINDPSTPQDSENQTNALMHYNVLNKLHTIKSESLIITATHDRTLPKMLSEKIHEKIPNSKLIVIEKAGHGSPLEKAPEINQYIIDFLKN